VRLDLQWSHVHFPELTGSIVRLLSSLDWPIPILTSPGVGPLLGALLAAAFYKLLKVLNYEDVNGDQDKAGDEMPDEGKPGADREEYRGYGRSKRPSQHSDHKHRAANGYSPNRRSGQYVQYGPHPPPMAVAAPVPPATYLSVFSAQTVKRKFHQRRLEEFTEQMNRTGK
jgi:hypothetical protein